MKVVLAVILILLALVVLISIVINYDFIRSEGGLTDGLEATASEAANMTHAQLTARSEEFGEEGR